MTHNAAVLESHDAPLKRREAGKSESRLRILVVGKYYPPFVGGIEANTASIARRLKRRHDVTVLVNAHDGVDVTESVDGVTVIRRRPQWVIQSQPISLTMFRDVRLSNYDVIHFHAPNPLAAAQLWRRLIFQRKRPALVITHHMEIAGRKLLRLLTLWPYRWLASRADAVIVTSQKNAAISRDLPAGVHTTAIPLGLDATRYILSEDMRAAAKAWRRSLAGDAPVVGFLGRHARYKGLDVLMRALAELPGVHAFVAGDGDERQATEQLSRDLGLTDRVHFLGKIDEASKLRLLAAIDVFAFPSTEITEAFGVSQMEAMLCGAPVVATDLPTGVTDVAIHETTALLATPGSAESLRACIEAVLFDATLANRLSHAGKQHVLTKMDEDIVTVIACEKIENVAYNRRLHHH